jgi:hypothetical protein
LGGKAKGKLQVLYKQGWIPVNAKRSDYVDEAKKVRDLDDDGNIKEDRKAFVTSYLVSQLADFENEISDLEWLAFELSDENNTISILFTPKYHCEMAGDGIEYCWTDRKYRLRIKSEMSRTSQIEGKRP